MTISCAAEIVALSDDISDIQIARADHLKEADGQRCVQHHVLDSSDEFEKAALASCSAVEEMKEAFGADRNAAIEKCVDPAAGFVFKMSPDYQMNKRVLSWTESPRPGPTYFIEENRVRSHNYVWVPGKNYGSVQILSGIEYVCGTRVLLVP